MGGRDDGAIPGWVRGARHGDGRHVQGDPWVGAVGGGLAAPGGVAVRDALRVKLGAGGRGRGGGVAMLA